MLIKLDNDFNLVSGFGHGGYALYDPSNYNGGSSGFYNVTVIDNHSSYAKIVACGYIYNDDNNSNPFQCAYIQDVYLNGNQSWYDVFSTDDLNNGIPFINNNLLTLSTFTTNIVPSYSVTPNSNITWATEIVHNSSGSNNNNLLVGLYCNYTQNGPVYNYYPLDPTLICNNNNSYGYQDQDETFQQVVLRIDSNTGALITTSGSPHGATFIKQFEGIDFFSRIVSPTQDGGYAVGSDLSYNLPSIPDAQLGFCPNNYPYQNEHLGIVNDIIKLDAQDNIQWDQQYLQSMETYPIPNGSVTSGVATNCLFGLAATNDGGFILAGNNELNSDDYYAIKLMPPTCSNTAVSLLNPVNNSTPKILIGTELPQGITTWNAPLTYVQGCVHVRAGSTLNISNGSTVEFANQTETGIISKIVVDSGGTLNQGGVLNLNGTLTSIPSCVNEMWGGIELRGQSDVGQSNLSTVQGRVNISNTGVISNANPGILTMKINADQTWDFNHTGGVIIANGATFINNTESIDMQAYINLNNPGANISYFDYCNFFTNDFPNQPKGFSPVTHVYLNQVYGVRFKGNTFNCQESFPQNYVSASSRGIGIQNFDASCSVTSNIFEDLQYGILSSSVDFNAIGINGNTFINNLFDISLTNNPASFITNNTFIKSYFGNESIFPAPYSMYLQGTQSFIISTNTVTIAPTFYNYNVPSSYGTIINNSFTNSNTIYDNIYNGNVFFNGQGLEVGIQPQGINGNNAIGLFIQCNTFNAHITTADIGLPQGATILNPQGTSISNSTTANNAFSNTSGAYDILDDANYSFTYNWSGTYTPYYPATIYGPVTVPQRPSYGTINCSNQVNWWNNRSELEYNKTQNQMDAITLQAQLNGGNASKLYSDLSAPITPAQLQDSLLEPGPYLSDGILIGAIHKNLPFDTLRNILITNAPLDIAVLDSLNRYYTLHQDSIIDTISGVSARTELMGDIAFDNNEIGIYSNAIVSYYLNDTIIGYIDSALAALSPATNNSTLSAIAGLLIVKDDTASAMDSIVIIRNSGDTMFTNFCTITPLLMRLKYQPNNYYALKTNHYDSVIFEQIAMDSNKPGFAQARAVLNMVFNQQFATPILPLTTGFGLNLHNNGKKSDSNQSINSNQSSFKLYPNPANNRITIEYTLSNNAQDAQVNIFDLFGKSITKWIIPVGESGNNVINENISSFVPGFYLYAIYVNGELIQRNKLIIVR